MFDPSSLATIEEIVDDQEEEILLSPKELERLEKLSVDEVWPTDEKLKQNSLVNGLKYYIYSSKPKQLLRLRLTVKVGSINEEDDELGYAHFLEHLMFRVTNLDEDIVQFMNSIGISFGAHVNGLTTFDFTHYDLVIPVDDSTFSEDSEALKHLHKALGIFAEWIFRAVFSRELVDLERNVVLREMEISMSDKGKMYEDALLSVLQGSSYANRQPMGTAECLSNCTAEKIQQFYSKWYQPHVMGLVVVGDIDAGATSKVEQLIREYFETNDKPPVHRGSLRLSTTRAISESKTQKKTIRDSWVRNVQSAQDEAPQICVYNDPDYRRAVVTLTYRFPDVTINKPNLTPRVELQELLKIVALNLMCASVRGNSKNFRRFVDSYSIGNAERLTQTMFTTYVSFGTSLENIFELVEYVLLEIKRFCTYGPLESEFLPMKELLKSYSERDSSSGDLINDVEETFLYNASFYSKSVLKHWTEKLWGVLTRQEFCKAATEIFRSEYAVLNLVSDFEGSGITPADAEARLLAAFQKVKDIPVSPLPDPEPWSLADHIPKSISKLADPSTLVKSQHFDKELGIIELEMKNGAKIQLKATDESIDYRADAADLGVRTEISAHGFGLAAVHFINPTKLWTARHVAYFFSELLNIPWYHHGRTMMDYGFKVSPPDVGLWSRGISMTSTVDAIESACMWIYHLFAQASSDSPFGGTYLEELLEVLKETDGIEKPATLMEKLAAKIREVEYKNCPLLDSTNKNKEVDFKWMKEYFQLIFSDPSEFTFSFVGSFGEDQFLLPQALKTIATYIGSIPKPKKRSPLFNKYHTLMPEEEICKQLVSQYYVFPKDSIDHYLVQSGGGNTAYMAMLWPAYLQDDTGYLLLSLCNTIVQQRLNRLLRFQLGEVYTLDVQMSWPYGITLPGQNGIFLYCQIDHVEKVVDLIINTLKEFQKEGPTHREIESACLQAQRQQMEAVQNTSVWAANLSTFKSRENAGEQTGDISPFMAQFGMLHQKEAFIDLLAKEAAGLIKQAFPTTSYQLFIGVPEDTEEQTVFPHTPAHVMTENPGMMSSKWVKAGAVVVAVSIVAAVAWRYYSRK